MNQGRAVANVHVAAMLREPTVADDVRMASPMHTRLAMMIHRTILAGTVCAFALSSSLALAQQTTSSGEDAKDRKHESANGNEKKGTKKVEPKANAPKADDAKPDKPQATPSDDTTGGTTGHSSTPSGDRETDSAHQRKSPETTTVAGQKATNRDEDLDMSVGKTETTAFDPNRRDVIESRAEERREGEGRRVTVAPLAGYSINDLHWGVGARAGYTFDKPFYVGGSFMYHGGDSQVVQRSGVTDSSSSYFYPGVEVGYDIGIGPILIRPYAGAALLFGRISTVSGGIESTATERALMVYPGVNTNYIIPRSPVFVGMDTRLLLPFENQSPSLSLLATTGVLL